MATNDDKLLIYFDDEAHLVRRLGAAVVACWSDLPDAICLKLIEHAKRVKDEDDSDVIGEQMKRFIADHTEGR